MHSSASQRLHHVAILAFYTLLAILLSWPLLAKFATHVPGVPQWAFDEATFLWNVWYLKHALVDMLTTPLHTDLTWYPLGIDLVLYTYNFLHALVAQPVMLAVNIPFASNLALLISTIVSAYGAYLLAAYLLQRHAPSHSPVLPALVAGLVYAFASNRAVYASLGHYDMVTTQWIPFYALMLYRSLGTHLSAKRRYQAAALAGFFMALNGLAEMITALFLGIFTLIVLVTMLWPRQRNSGANAHHLFMSIGFFMSMGIIGIVAFLVWAPVLLPVLRQFLTDDFSLQGWGEAIPLSTDLLGWFTPTTLHPIFGTAIVEELRRVQLRALEQGVTGFRDFNTVFLGWVTLLLALLGAVRYRRHVSAWIATATIFGILTLGPFLQINGRYRFDLDGIETAFPLPFAILHYIPIIKANRAPNRNSVLLMLGLAILVAYALHWLICELRHAARGQFLRRGLVAITAGLILFEHLALPMPLTDMRVPAVYDQIAADPRPVSLMHLPLGWRNSFGVFGPERTQLQYYQSVHGKPMLGGNISRAPDFKMDYFARIPFFQVLTDIQFGRQVDPEQLAAARLQAADLIYLYNVGYLLLMPPIPQRFPYADHWQAAWSFARETLPLETDPFWQSDGIEAYRVATQPGDDSFRLDLGAPLTYAYRGEGWDRAEIDMPYQQTAIWATARESMLFLPLRNVDPTATYAIQINVHPFAYPGATQQTVTPMVNGLAFESKAVGDSWQLLRWEIPGTALLDSLNRVALTWHRTATPRAVLGGSRAIGSTDVEMPLDVDLKAFADGGFIALFDDEGKQIDASSGRRGVNITVLEAQSGDVLEMVGFDTAANSYQSEQLATFLYALPVGQIVLVVSHGEATAHLTQEAVEAMQTIGLDVGLAQLQDNQFAIAGVSGIGPNRAAVAIHPEEAFLRISLERDRRDLAAAVDWVEIQRVE